jgi:uncharacterized repeat protein (TIGR01451 family)
MGYPGASVTFTGSGGTAPYTFTYTLSGMGNPYNITSSGNSASPDLSFLPPGSFVITITNISDANANSQSLNVTGNIVVNPPPTPNIGPNQTICEGSVLTLGGTGQGGWTYNWNGPNGFNSTMMMPVINPVTLASAGNYNLFVVDQYGCFGQSSVNINVIPLPTQPTIVVDSAVCNDGSINMTEPSNYGPYTVLWSNGTTSFIMGGLPAITYTYQLINSYGCTYNGAVSVPQSSLPAQCATVSGTVRIDTNGDCLVDAGDVPVQNRLIRANPGNFLASTDASGNYTLYLDPGTYTIDELFPNSSTANACTPSFSVNLPDPSASISGIDFMDTITNGVDLSIQLFTSQIRPQMSSLLNVIVSDQSGNGLTAGLDGWFTLPAGIQLYGLNTTYTQSNDTVYFQFYSNQTTVYLQGVIFNSSLPAGSMPIFYGAIETLPTETIISNNSTVYQTFVVNSFDPNDKTTFINGVQNDSNIYLSEQSLTYLIRFQNTGTAEAIDIHVMDTISEYLDLNTFEMLGTSHPCQVYFNGREVKFDFPGIYLADSTSNEPESHGFILYRIRQDQSNTVGNVINNTAFIFFDFNEAVITNTTWDEIVEPSTNSVAELSDGTVKLYPNPANNIMHITAENPVDKLTIYSVNGTAILALADQGNYLNLDVSGLNSGMYIVEVIANGQRSIFQVIKE